MEPVHCGALDESWETSSPHAEGGSHGRQAQHHLERKKQRVEIWPSVHTLHTAESASQRQRSSDTSPPWGGKKHPTNWQPARPRSLTWHRVRTVGRVPRRLEQTVEPPEALAYAQAGWQAHGVTLRRDLSVSISRLAPLVLPNIFIYVMQQLRF